MICRLILAIRVWRWRRAHPEQYRAVQARHRALSNKYDWNRWKEPRP